MTHSDWKRTFLDYFSDCCNLTGFFKNCCLSFQELVGFWKKSRTNPKRLIVISCLIRIPSHIQSDRIFGGRGHCYSTLTINTTEQVISQKCKVRESASWRIQGFFVVKILVCEKLIRILHEAYNSVSHHMWQVNFSGEPISSLDSQLDRIIEDHYHHMRIRTFVNMISEDFKACVLCEQLFRIKTPITGRRLLKIIPPFSPLMSA